LAALSIVLLVAGVAGAVVRPFGLPAWVVPLVAAGADLLAGAAKIGGAHGAVHALHQLDQPIGFLLAAVPLAVLLDRLGFFAAAAELMSRGRAGTGGLWILAALVTTVLNLDAGVVLLTPLYVNIARRRGLDPLVLALQPVILSWLASSALPVSNLTNLIAVSSTGARTSEFVGHLGLPSLVAVIVGWYCYRRLTRPRPYGAAPAEAAAPADGAAPAEAAASPDAAVAPGAEARRALRIGGAVVGVVLVGFVGGRSVGVDAWEVALVADAVLLVVVRRPPWRSVPVGTALVAASLAVLASAAVTHLDVAGLLGGDDLLGLARTAGVTAVLANVVNNLPALLVVLPAVGSRPDPSLWATLVGVNMGPVLLVTGTLASLLWLDTLRRLGVAASGRDLTRVGARVGLPASACGLATLLGLHAAGLAR
jgi:arsenical pump membrane protein